MNPAGDGPRVDRLNAEPMWQQLAGILRTAIIDGELLVGHAIPSKRALSEFHNVSVGTVESAASALKAEGLIEPQPGKGMYVIKKPAPRTTSNLPANATLLQEAISSARTAALKSTDTSRQLTRLADLVAGHMDDTDASQLTRQAIRNLRVEAEHAYLSLHRILTGFEHAKMSIDGLTASDVSDQAFAK